LDGIWKISSHLHLLSLTTCCYLDLPIAHLSYIIISPVMFQPKCFNMAFVIAYNTWPNCWFASQPFFILMKPSPFNEFFHNNCWISFFGYWKNVIPSNNSCCLLIQYLHTQLPYFQIRKSLSHSLKCSKLYHASMHSNTFPPHLFLT
jgi:hypothetical protein